VFDVRKSDIYEVNAKFISNVEIFSTLDRKQINKLSRLCLYRTYPKGQVIIKEGDTGLGLFIITSGKVGVFKDYDKNQVVLANLEKGACVGELALLDEQPRSATVVSSEDVECLLITRDSFNKLVRKDADIVLRIASTITDKLRRANSKLMELTSQEGSAKPAEVKSTPSNSAEKNKAKEEDKVEAKTVSQEETEPESTEYEEDDSSESGGGFSGFIAKIHEKISDLGIHEKISGVIPKSIRQHFHPDD